MYMAAECVEFERDLLRVFRQAELRVWGEDGDYAFAPTGELYWLVTSGGKLPDGTRPTYFADRRRAHREFDHKVRNLVQGFADRIDELVVYFRMRPEMFCESEGFCVVSRFLISDLPVIYPAKYDALFSPHGP
jgi:hypothetical protein